MPVGGAADSGGQLDREQVELALRNVSHIFGDGEASGDSARGSRRRVQSKNDDLDRSTRFGSAGSVMLGGRGRVDSVARPAHFMENGNGTTPKEPRASWRERSSDSMDFFQHVRCAQWPAFPDSLEPLLALLTMRTLARGQIRFCVRILSCMPSLPPVITTGSAPDIDKKQDLRLGLFREHGINEGTLRHRMASKAIDAQVLERVRTDFPAHDHLSDKELANLDQLVTKAHKLHMDR